LCRKEEEEKRRREEEALIGNVYKEFEEHFDDRPTAKINKTWVKAGTFNAGRKKTGYTRFKWKFDSSFPVYEL
jgi:U2-associated protein SR140